MHSLDWTDLRIAGAVAEAGSLASAARRLGLNHSTVLRRLAAMEARLGLRLFDRTATGTRPTEAGQEVLATAREVAGSVEALERRLAGQDPRLSGPLTIATTDTIAATLLMPVLAAFRAAHPGIVPEIAIGNAMADLGRREAEVAIRPAEDPPGALVGRRLAGIAYAVYAAEGTAPEAWIAPGRGLGSTVTARWMRDTLPAETAIVGHFDSFLAMRDAARAGLGRALLPCYLGDGAPGLRRIGGVVPEARSSLWLLTHEDLRRTVRVRAFTEVAARAIAGHRPRLEGTTRPA